MINTNQLKEIIEDLTKMLSSLNLQVTDSETSNFISPSIIFQEACTYHRGILMNQNRQSNQEQPINKITPPTNKQLNLLKKLGWTGEEPKTKVEAMHLIDSYFSKEGGST